MTPSASIQLHRVIQHGHGLGGLITCTSSRLAGRRVGAPAPTMTSSVARAWRFPSAYDALPISLEGNRKFRYWYDFGDDWWHTVAIEKRLPADAEAPPAQLLAGENACPPEDCGGLWGYADLLDALADPATMKSTNSLKDWIGDDFDPTRLRSSGPCATGRENYQETDAGKEGSGGVKFVLLVFR